MKSTAVKFFATALFACGALAANSAGFDGMTLVTNDWFDASFTSLAVDTTIATNTATGITRGAGMWTEAPTNGTATIVADAEAGGDATFLSLNAPGEMLKFTPASLSTPSGMETVTAEVKITPVDGELPAISAGAQGAFTLKVDGEGALTVHGQTAAGWTNLVYASAQDLTNGWVAVVMDFATVSNVRYVRYSVTVGGSRTVLEDSTGAAWFPASGSATTVTAVGFSGVGNIRSFSGDSLAEPIATCNGENYATVADAIAAAEDGDTVTLVKTAYNELISITRNVSIDLNSNPLNCDAFDIASGITLTVVNNGGKQIKVPCITGGGDIVATKGLRLCFTNEAATSTIGSINVTGAFSIDENSTGTINVTGDVDVSGAMTITPAAASQTIINAHSGYTVKLTANSITAGSLTGGAVIETTDGVTVSGGTFYGSIGGTGGLNAGGDFTLQGPNTFTGDLTVGTGKTLYITNRLDAITALRFHVDAAADTFTYTTNDDDEKLVQTFTSNRGLTWRPGTDNASHAPKTNAIYKAVANVFDGREVFYFDDSCYTLPDKEYSDAFMLVYQAPEITGDILKNYYRSSKDMVKGETAQWGVYRKNVEYGNWAAYVDGIHTRSASADTKSVLSVMTKIANSTRSDWLGGTYVGYIAEAIGFTSMISIEDRNAIEAHLMQKWNLNNASSHRMIPSAANVTLGTGAVLDLGGYTNFVAATFTGGGTVQNGTLYTVGNVYTNTGALVINAVDNMTIVLDAGATSLTLNGDATGITIDATDEFMAAAGTVTITAIGLSAAPTFTSAIGNTIFRYGTTDNGDGTWTVGAISSSSYTAATYTWSPVNNNTDWSSLANWSVEGFESVLVLPQSVDTVVFPVSEDEGFTGWTVSIGTSPNVAAATINGATIITTGGSTYYLQTSAINGMGTVTLSNARIRAKTSFTMSNPIVIASGTENILEGNGSCVITLNGAMSGSGKLTCQQSTSGGTWGGVHFNVDNPDFTGELVLYGNGSTRASMEMYNTGAVNSNTFLTIDYMSGSENHNVFPFFSAAASSWEIGALNGSIKNYRENVKNRDITLTDLTLKVGNLNEDCSLDGSWASVRTASNYFFAGLEWVATTAEMEYGVAQTKWLKISGGGALKITSASALPSSYLSFTDNGGTLKTTYTTDDSGEVPVYTPIDPSACIKNSSSAITFDDEGTNRVWATALAASNTGGLVKKGAGTLTLTAAPLYTGDTYLDGGVLKVPATWTGRVKTNVSKMGVYKSSETIDDVEYTVYWLGKRGSIAIIY